MVCSEKKPFPVAATAANSSSGNALPDNGARNTARPYFPSNYQCLRNAEEEKKDDERHNRHFSLSLAINKIERFLQNSGAIFVIITKS